MAKASWSTEISKNLVASIFRRLDDDVYVHLNAVKMTQPQHGGQYKCDVMSCLLTCGPKCSAAVLMSVH
jgi:hypothetical protein